MTRTWIYYASWLAVLWTLSAPVLSTDNSTQGMPLLGERFPEMTVQTTQGTMQLPDAYWKMVCTIQPSRRFHSGVHDGVCGLRQ